MAYEKSKVSSFGSGSLDSPPLVGFEYCHQFSRTPGEVPDAATLGEGEIAINLADGLLYIKGSSGAVVQAGGGSSGPNQVVSSGGIANLTSGQQGDVEIGTIVTTTDGRRWVYKGEGSKTSEASYIELADITPVWSVIADKPATFAPSAHVHAISDVTNLEAALNGKQASGSYASASHSHAISDVTNLQTSLNAKVSSITTGITGADQITNMVSLTQAEYDAIPTKSATTFYVITG